MEQHRFGSTQREVKEPGTSITVIAPRRWSQRRPPPRRDRVFLVSKVLPGNASRRGTIIACEKSLARLHTDRLDSYLLHWRGQHPLEETIAAFEQLQHEGKILCWGVSNFDVPFHDLLLLDRVGWLLQLC